MPTQDPAITRMRRDLTAPVAAGVWPTGVRLTAFTPERAREVHALMLLAYANSGGSVAPFAVRWPWLTSDSQYDPSLCFFAVHATCQIVGVAQCWTSAFVKDLVIHPHWRGCHIGAALMLRAFEVFCSRDAPYVDLKVQAGHDPARRL